MQPLFVSSQLKNILSINLISKQSRLNQKYDTFWFVALKKYHWFNIIKYILPLFESMFQTWALLTNVFSIFKFPKRIHTLFQTIRKSIFYISKDLRRLVTFLLPALAICRWILHQASFPTSTFIFDIDMATKISASFIHKINVQTIVYALSGWALKRFCVLKVKSLMSFI